MEKQFSLPLITSSNKKVQENFFQTFLITYCRIKKRERENKKRKGKKRKKKKNSFQCPEQLLLSPYYLDHSPC